MSNAAVKSLQPALAERVRELLQRVSYRRADTDEDREAIYRLRYRAYLDEGAIEPDFGRRLSDRFDESTTVGLLASTPVDVLSVRYVSMSPTRIIPRSSRRMCFRTR